MPLPSFTIPQSEEQARAIQQSLRAKISLVNGFSSLNRITGVDVGYDVGQNRAHASLVIVSFPGLMVMEQVQAFAPAAFPYIPGLLSFREIPAILAALEKLSTTPDLFMVDGQGIAHPRRMGIATHLGVLLDKPSIGVAKSRLSGTFTELGVRKGDQSPLTAGAEKIGVVLRSKEKCNPLFISPGHRVDMDTAVSIALQCLTRYRLPEPTRLADKYSKYKAAQHAAA